MGKGVGQENLEQRKGQGVPAETSMYITHRLRKALGGFWFPSVLLPQMSVCHI